MKKTTLTCDLCQESINYRGIEVKDLSNDEVSHFCSPLHYQIKIHQILKEKAEININYEESYRRKIERDVRDKIMKENNED